MRVRDVVNPGKGPAAISLQRFRVDGDGGGRSGAAKRDCPLSPGPARTPRPAPSSPRTAPLGRRRVRAAVRAPWFVGSRWLHSGNFAPRGRQGQERRRVDQPRDPVLPAGVEDVPRTDDVHVVEVLTAALPDADESSGVADSVDLPHGRIDVLARPEIPGHARGRSGPDAGRRRLASARGDASARAIAEPR